MNPTHEQIEESRYCIDITHEEIQASIISQHDNKMQIKKAKRMIGKQYQHKNGNIYTVIMVTNTSNLSEKHPIDVVYIGWNGAIWSRPLSDWDRSFKLILE